ncbi:MAG: hypothetical protein KC912_02035 [Proteobacteria bacterium]|nr:hypothetical protein [Pseudomonadota bacterium]
MSRMLRVLLWTEAVLMLVLCPVVLIVPEIPLGRVVAVEPRWLMAAGCAVVALLCVVTLRSSRPDLRRGSGTALVVANLVQATAGVAVPGGPQSVAHIGVGLLFAGVAIAAMRSPVESAVP